MAAAAACLKWVDVLETQFDKSWVALDLLLNQIDEDEDDIQISPLCRKHASSLASCFSQLAHKSTVVFQNNAKLEAELFHLREEISLCKMALDKIKAEKEYVTASLQSVLGENHSLKHRAESSEIEENGVTDLKKDKLAGCSQSRGTSLEPGDTSSSYISDRLSSENALLRRELLDLESELVGARLDNVYLDKELAGRIQQIQLLASSTPSEMKERLWTQIEAEMCLQRAKTIAHICKTKQELRVKRAKEFPCILPEKERLEEQEEQEEEERNGYRRGKDPDHSHHARGKQVMVLKNPADDLGMAIIGGAEHNLPVIVSEVFPGSAVSRAARLKAGDIILSVNGQDFTAIGHQEAVTFLSALRGQITFELQAAEVMSEDDPSNLDFRFYRLFDGNPGSPSKEANGGSPHIPVHPGRAVSSVDLAVSPVDLNSFSNVVSVDGEQLPTVHSPRRDNAKLSTADSPTKIETGSGISSAEAPAQSVDNLNPQ